MRRYGIAFAIAAVLAIPAPAYYHFIHYLNGIAVPEKFDLSVLPDKTVSFFVSQDGPATYTPTDSFNSVVGQLRQAVAVWNAVPSSDLRVAFGGLENTATLQNTPGGDIVFEDLPPGLLGYGGPTSLAAPVVTATGSFVPIRRAAVHLNRNLRLAPGPSYNETFFMTAVHEMGHALGLQHTFTSATMSTATTRATTVSHPLDGDDVAAISSLYPNAAFAKFGSISGRITNGGVGVHLSSVVAIRAGGSAISALTNPDGTYRISGIPAGQYFVYAHPLPPDADIYGPWNADGSVAARSETTNALFYPGTTSLGDATPISVQSAQTVEQVNVALSSRTSVPIYDAGVYGYFKNYTMAVKPAYVNMLGDNSTVVAAGVGLGANGQAAGLNVQFLGNSARIEQGGIRPYEANGFTYIALDLGFNLFAGTGQQHLVFSTPNFLHVLPAGVILTRQSPPEVSAVASNNDGTLTVAGTNWNAETRLYFDGLPATLVALDAKTGMAVVIPPAGADGQVATITAYNLDGQNSQFVQAATPVRWAYGASTTPLITSISPSSLPAGSESLIDINTNGFAFSPSQVVVGFGTSDVVVRGVFVLGPNRVVVNVSVANGAALSNSVVSVISGFQLATSPSGFQITPPVPTRPRIVPVFSNAQPGLTGAYAGALVNVRGANLLPQGAGAVLTVGAKATTIVQATETLMTFQLPAALPPGPAVLTFNNGAAEAFPLLISIDTPPATIRQLLNSNGVPISLGTPARQGEVLGLVVDGFFPTTGTLALERTSVSVGGVAYVPLSATPLTGNTWQLNLIVSAAAPVGSTQPLIVYLDGRSSYPATISLARADGSLLPDNPTPPLQPNSPE